MTANDNNAHDLHQPAVSVSSALRTGACAQACFWVVCLLFGASCRESRFSRRCFASRAEIPNADAPGAALTAVKRGTMSRRENRRSAFRRTFRLTCFFFKMCCNIFYLSVSALKSVSVFAVIRLLQFMCKCIQKCAAGM